MSNSQTQKHVSVEEDRGRAEVIYHDASCQKLILTAMKSYIESLKTGSKHVYQALPRLLSLWFEVTAIEKTSEEKTPSKSGTGQATYSSSRRHSGAGTGIVNDRGEPD